MDRYYILCILFIHVGYKESCNESGCSFSTD